MNMQAAVFARTRTSTLTVKQRDMLVGACHDKGVLSRYAHSRTRFALLRDGYVTLVEGVVMVTEKGRDAVRGYWPSDVLVDNPRKLPNGRTGVC